MDVDLSPFSDILEEKKLYSPGPVPQRMVIDVSYSHRSIEFKNLYREILRLLREKYQVPSEYGVVLIQGSATSAIESVLYSLSHIKFRFLCTGVFGQRAEKIYTRISERQNTKKVGNGLYYVQFETSKSKYSSLAYNLDDYDLVVADCVSGFGYYPLPKVNVAITSSAKILGGLPALGIVIYDEKALSYFKGGIDYLDILKYIELGVDFQTPHTPMLPQMMSLQKQLEDPISRKQIETNSNSLVSSKIVFCGETKSPVLTVCSPGYSSVKDTFREHNIEVYHNSAYMEDQFQVSMYNYRDERYYSLLRILLEGIIDENRLSA